MVEWLYGCMYREEIRGRGRSNERVGHGVMRGYGVMRGCGMDMITFLVPESCRSLATSSLMKGSLCFGGPCQTRHGWK